MPINFPDSPVNGQEYTAEGVTWAYDGGVMAWVVLSQEVPTFVPATVPDAFVIGDWTAVQGSGLSEVDVTILSLPENNGAVITAVEYRVDAGAWVDLGATSGAVTLTLPAPGVSYGIDLRAVNGVGAGPAGDLKNVTSGIAVPDAFVGADWSVATGSGANELDVTIASLPVANGSAITDVEYDIDGNGVWVSLGATSGTVTVTMASPSTSYALRLRAVNGAGSGAAGNSESAVSGAVPATVPDAFTVGQWAVATGSGLAEIDITLLTLPSDNGASITLIEYRLDGGAWVDIGAVTTGVYTVTAPLPGVSYSVEVRASNSVGAAPASDLKNVTSGAVAPDAFTAPDWSVATGSGANEADITINSLPAANGSTITAVEYQVDGGSWVNLGATSGTVTVTLAAPSTVYSIVLRAVNAEGAGAGGDAKNVTSGAVPAGVPAAFTAPDWTLAQGSGARELDVGIVSLPADNGSAITDVEYRVDAGAWVNLGATSGTVTITLPAALVSYNVQLRAVNGVGAGPVGDTKAETSGFEGPSIPGVPTLDNTTPEVGDTLTATASEPVGGDPVPDREWEFRYGGTIETPQVSNQYVAPPAALGEVIRVRQIESQTGGGITSALSAPTAAVIDEPDAFVDANWSVSTGSGANELDITIASLPADNGSAITDIEYDVDASGTWISLATAVAGTVTVTMAAPGTSYDIRLRAVNAAGAGAAGNSESATSGAAGSVPDAFTVGQWSAATGTGDRAIDVTLTALPSDNGSALTALEFRLDGGAWNDLGGLTTGTYEITAPLASTSYNIELRAVNAVGAGPASDTKSATSNVAGSDPYAVDSISPEVVADFANVVPLYRKGGTDLVTGPELITNGDFEAGTGSWTYTNCNADIVSDGNAETPNNIRLTATGGGASTAHQAITTEVGKTYLVTADFVDATYILGTYDGTITAGTTPRNIDLGTSNEPPDDDTPTKLRLVFTATGTTTYITLRGRNGSGQTIFDNASVVEADFYNLLSHSRGSDATYFDASGNLQTATVDDPRVDSHLYNGTSWERAGMLLETTAATNLNTYSEDFSNGVWSKNNITANADAIGPDGQANSAYTLLANSGGSTGWCTALQVFTTTAEEHTCSVFAKAGTLSWMCLKLNAWVGASGETFFDLSTGTIGTIAANHSNATIEDVGNGWYRCSITFTVDSGDLTGNLQIHLADADGDIQVLRNGTNSILVYGVQLETGGLPTSYIPTSGLVVTRAQETLEMLDAAYNPTSSVSHNVKFRYSFPDDDSISVVWQHREDSDDYIRTVLDTQGGLTGQFRVEQRRGGLGSVTAITAKDDTPGLNRQLNIASRHGLTDMNVAESGASKTAQSTGGNYPSLNNDPLTFDFARGPAHIDLIRFWENDELTDAQLEEATLNDPYAVDNISPELVADFAGTYPRHRKNGGDYVPFDEVFTYSRASDATYFDANGDLQTATSEEPRVDSHLYNGTSWERAGMLLEATASTNYVYPSTPGNFTTLSENNRWRIQNLFQALENQADSPIGVNNASAIYSNNSNDFKRTFHKVVQSGLQPCTFSCYLKNGNNQRYVNLAILGSVWRYVTFDLDAGVITEEGVSADGGIEPVGDGWYYCRVTADMTSNSSNSFVSVFLSDTGTPGQADVAFVGSQSDFLLIDGAQVENTLLPTSLIPTTTAIATRVAETLEIPVSSHQHTTSGMSWSMQGLVSQVDEDEQFGTTFFQMFDGNNSLSQIRRATDGSNNAYYARFLSNGLDRQVITSLEPSPFGLNQEFYWAFADAGGGNVNLSSKGVREVIGSTGGPDSDVVNQPAAVRPQRAGHLKLIKSWTSVLSSDQINEETSG